MSAVQRAALPVGLVAVIATGLLAAAATPTVSASPAMTPVIGAPVVAPTQPLPGKRLTVRFKVTRSDTRAPLIHGRMNCAPSVNGRTLAHSESFTSGIARLSMQIPVAAQGKDLTVRLTITSARSSATRVARLHIRALAKPALSIGDASISEGNGGSATLGFPVTLSAGTPLPVSVRFATSDALASAGVDYTATSGVLTLKPGQRSGTITVAAIGDVVVEPDETLTITLSGAVNATIHDATATGTIVNDDVPARSGHYTGSTSLWTFIAFDVSEGAKSVTGLFFFADLTCDTPLSILKGAKIEFLDPVPVGPDGTFSAAYNGTTPSYITMNVTLTGRLRAPGTATGTLRVIDITSTQVPFRGAHCSTGDATWDAS